MMRAKVLQADLIPLLEYRDRSQDRPLTRHRFLQSLSGMLAVTAAALAGFAFWLPLPTIFSGVTVTLTIGFMLRASGIKSWIPFKSVWILGAATFGLSARA